ncbi:PrgI family protein [Candidatus Saccharibacteria bacterium]|nr:PrgI family protein [Candidatus Saccharibacteria bacterium]
MAQYKVPQDVEADDKLIGPFSFRQFVYLLIVGGLVALAVGLFQLFPLLAIIPVPFALFFLTLALPLKKDQPMETYLAAIVSYYLKPRTRIWTPGQRESTILITAPKIIEEVRTRNISSEEATHRLSFLADIVDTEGYAIKGAGNNSMREDLIAEANATTDMFESYESKNLERAINESQAAQQQVARENVQTEIDRREAKRNEREQKKAEEKQRKVEEEKRLREEEQRIQEEERKRIEEEQVRLAEERRKFEEERKKYEEELARQKAEHAAEIEKMRGAIAKSSEIEIGDTTIKNQRGSIGTGEIETKKGSTRMTKNSIMELANNTDYTVATIAKEANRIKGKEEGEVFVSLH